MHLLVHNHVGFILICLSVFSSSTAAYSQSVETFIFYIFQYTFTNLNIFLIILALSYYINNQINFSSYTNTTAEGSYATLGDLKVENNTNFILSSFTLTLNANNFLSVYVNKLLLDKKHFYFNLLVNISDIDYINSFKGIFYKNPVLSLSLAVCLFSFAGVPPLIGFFAKQQVLYSSNSAGFFFYR